MKKKIAAFVLATALVIPLSVPAFAATPSDVAGKPEQSAVEELVALGVFNGYEDGTFKPGNEITRAELAKAAIIASGNESAANILKNVKPSFSDVKQSVWYSGYINAAAQKGYIVGYNGKFRPSDSVKFEEVVAIMLRALGYKEANLSGAWPYNYLIKADEINLFDKVSSVDVGKNALRGTVAQLTSATINTNTITYNSVTGLETAGAPLVGKIGSPKSGILLASAVDSNKNLSFTTEAGVASTVAVSDNVIVTGGKKLADLLGREVSYILKNDKIVVISDNQDAAKVIKGVKSVAQTVANSAYLTVKVGDELVTKQYSSANPVRSFVNGDANTALTVDDEVEYFLNADGTVRFVKATKWNVLDARVTSLDAKTAYRAARLNVDTDRSATTSAATVSVPDTAVVTLNGVASKVEDLLANDIVTYASNAAGAVKIEATRNVVTGKVVGQTTVNGTAAYTIDGKQYSVLTGVGALTINNSYTLLLNKDGKVADASAPTVGANSNDVVITKLENVSVIEDGIIAAKKRITYFSVKDNAKQTALVASDATFVGTLAEDHVQTFAYTDGKISGVTDVLNLGTTTAVDSKTATTLTTVTGSTYTTLQYDSSTIVLKATDLVNDNVTVGTIADITKADVVAVAGNGVKASFVVLLTDNEAVSATLPAVHGLLVEKVASSNGTTTTYAVKLNVKGETKEFPISLAAYNTIGTTAKAPVELTDTVTTNAVYDVASVTADSSAAGSAIAVNSNNSTFTVGGANYIATGNTSVFFVSATDVVSVGNYADIVGAKEDTAGTYTVSVFAGTTSIGIYNEAALVIVKKN
ncbi:S-layer homology domain-containing protein [Paenibacillus sp. LPE1-1-1.1]|uniref:S-layer homology domain-containing protein n=1 Tax=Paenibacillus sp. LPE1-1-1.1 TaxID=3135230 RepID=UPI00344ACC1A